MYRPTILEVSASAIRHNVASIVHYYEAHHEPIRHFYAVVKANGYGHGAIDVARVALEAGATRLAVATFEEALHLRDYFSDVPILVLGAVATEVIAKAVSLNVTLTIPSVDWLERARCEAAHLPLTVHIKIDSGMGRIGVSTSEEVKRIAQLLRDTSYEVEGVFTHFARADERDRTYTDQQVARFKTLIQSLDERPPIVHAANTAAVYRFPEYAFDAVRYGIGLYGLVPSEAIRHEIPIELRPALSLRTAITAVKRVAHDTPISYGGRYTSTKEEYIATLPIGYADGLSRQLTGQTVLVQGEKAQIVGTICMDQCMIALPRHYPPGTIVTFLGEDEREEIGVEQWSQRLNTISYEICTSFSARIPRKMSQ